MVDYQTNWKNRGYDTAVLAAPIEIGGKCHYMGIVLIRGQNDQSFYVHEVLSIEEGAVPFKTGTVNTNGNTGGNTPSVFSILQKIIAVNNFDENKSDISAITVKKYDLADDDADGMLNENGEVKDEYFTAAVARAQQCKAPDPEPAEKRAERMIETRKEKFSKFLRQAATIQRKLEKLKKAADKKSNAAHVKKLKQEYRERH